MKKRGILEKKKQREYKEQRVTHQYENYVKKKNMKN